MGTSRASLIAWIGVSWMLIGSPAWAQEDTAAAAAAMRDLATKWQQAITQGKPFVKQCADQTWALARFAPESAVKVDLRRTDSLMNPIVGIIYISGRVESNGSSPNADGFFSKYSTPPRFLCFGTLERARGAVGDEDWREQSNMLNFDFEAYYQFDGREFRLEKGNAYFNNAAWNTGLSLPENQPDWAALIVQPVTLPKTSTGNGG